MVWPALNPRPGFTPQVLFGLLVIVAGVLFTLDNLGVVDAGQYLQYWPSALVAIGLVKLWHAREGQGWVGGFFLVLLGGWMLLERVVAIRISLHDLWPLLFVFLGGYLVWKGLGGVRHGPAGDGHARFSALAIMSGVVRRSNTQAFEGADLTAIMGGCEIDLRQASIAPGTEAIIDVFAFWGGIDIKVPEDWLVITRAVPLMGGIEDKTHSPVSPAARTLIIRGIVIMGGVTIKNVDRRGDD
jgi:cell wall-active antibiotic response 4TMS protein YvqF